MMYQQQRAPMEGVAKQMAKHGRYGDSMLVHMNPIEVQGIASLSPTGKLTTNPVTGQPEAFLPFLAPLLGSLAGSTLLTGAGAGALGGLIGAGGLSSAAAGAIGSGLATAASTGDLKQGILAGITGYGLGSALGGASESLSPAVESASEAVTQSQGVLDSATKAATEAAAKGAMDVPVAAGMQGPPVPFAEEMTRRAAQSNLANAQDALGSVSQQAQGQIGQSFMQNPMEFTKAFGSQMMSPSTLAPIAIGEGKREELRIQDEMDAMGRQEQKRKQEELDRAVGNMRGAYQQLESDYPGYKIPGYAGGGITSVNPRNYMENMQGLQRLAAGGTASYSPVIDPSGAAQRQANIRGSQTISRAELEGYRPGFDAEISYFKRPGEGDGYPQADRPVMTGDVTSTPGGTNDYLTADQQNQLRTILGGKGGLNAGGPNFDAMSYNYSTNEPLSGMNAGSAFTAYTGGTGTSPLGIDVLRNPSSRNPSQIDDTYFSNPRGNIYSRYTQQYKEGGDVEVDIELNATPEDDEFMAETNDANGGRLIEMASLAVAGRLPEEEASVVIKRFIDEFGPEAFQMLRERVLKETVPNAQIEGKINGNGKGMDDMVPGMIGDQQPVAVSPGEYIVPADVVSGLGDGDTGAGAQELDKMMEKVRQERTGTSRQPSPVNTQKVMPV